MSPSSRIPEIDFFRGTAIILMVVFHTVFDLASFYGWPLDYMNGFWYLEGRASAVLFMLISGISSTLSRNPVHRGIKVFGAGLIITAVTFFFSPEVYIRFGILHLLGTGMITAPFFSRYGATLLATAGMTVIAVGNWTADLIAATATLVPLGIKPPGFASLDYYPLFPWLGVVLLGMAAGKLLYPDRQPLWPAASGYRPVRWLICLGRHSLVIYLVHQPVLLVLLKMIL
ncbi:hypothetical protein SCACP_02870 [Sporomusa carbonis]|uniref:heparan-alpha-glucosaminide N-acetyltransferase n=1 Tax=Sporomusa carbonis TaxID=3076075 RepID=UPI003A7A4BC0